MLFFRSSQILLIGGAVLLSAAEEQNLPSPVPGAAAFLQRHPESDVNKDGILTAEEKLEFSKDLAIQKLGGNYVYYQMKVPMRDGVNLATGIFLPKTPGKKSTVLCRTAYSIWAASNFDTTRLANKNLVYVCQDLRGDGESEGAGTVDLTSFDNEINDGYDTIDWIIQQPWSNGKVGMTGQSGHGFATYMAYLANHPNLVAADTNVSGGNAHLYWTYHNGVKREMYYRWLAQRNIPIPVWPKPGIEMFDREQYRQTVEAAAKDNEAVFIARTGWYDIFAESALDYFRDFAKDGSLFVRVDPSGHGGMKGKPFPKREVPAEWKLPDFTEVLKDQDAATPAKSRMAYYLMGDGTDPNAPGNVYKSTDVWPVPHTPTAWYCHGDGTLSLQKPGAEGSLTFSYDPRDPVPSAGGDVFIHQGVGPLDQRVLKDRKDILRFTSEPLTEPVEITGKVFAELYVSTDVLDTTFTAKLIDIYPDGHEAVVRDSIIMGRFHQGFDKQVPMAKEQIYKLTLDMWSTALVVNKGHRLAVHISSSNSPKYEVHPNTFDPVNSFEQSPVANNTIYLSAEHPSHVILPVVSVE